MFVFKKAIVFVTASKFQPNQIIAGKAGAPYWTP